MKKQENKKENEVRICKKCGEELASDSKHKLCDNCRRERAAKIRHTMEGIGATALAMVMIIPRILDALGNLDDSTSADNDNDSNDDMA